MDSNLEVAVDEYIDRASGKQPDGRRDHAGRWQPSDRERCGCCAAIRQPSRRYGQSLLMHCRSLEHISRLYGVDALELRRAVMAKRKSAKRQKGA